MAPAKSAFSRSALFRSASRRFAPRIKAPLSFAPRLLESRPPVEYFGRYWSDLVSQGFHALGALDADQYLEVCFEDLVAKPEKVLRIISEFFELDPEREGWIERAAGLVRGIPPTRFAQLSRDERERLAQACRADQQLLGRTA